MNTQLLPVGSVVTLKEAKKKLMVIGVFLSDEKGTTHEYMGIPYPEGFIDMETIFLFDHKDIEDIHFLGFINAEHQAFRAELAKDLETRGVIKRA